MPEELRPNSHADQRREQTADLVQQFGLPSNWTSGIPSSKIELPQRGEITAKTPASINGRGSFVRCLREFQRALNSDALLKTVAADPYHARTYWDVLVRLRCLAARPRLSDPTHFQAPQSLRGGLWNIPVSCSFSGGAAKTVWSQFALCRDLLIDYAENGRVFHLTVDVGPERTSWREERDALGALFQAAG